MNPQRYFKIPQSRRSVLQQFGALALGTSVLNACGTTEPTTKTSDDEPNEAIQHVLIACQENRTFDTYFGFYPKAGKFGMPTNISLLDKKGNIVKPHHFTTNDTTDIAHDWGIIHSEYNNGKMDGFALVDGP